MAETEKALGLNKLQAPLGSRKEKKRVGRGHGSGLGETAGRGVKGQKSRAGSLKARGFEGGQMPLHRRLPKFGFKSPFKKYFEVVNVEQLENHFQSGDTVDVLKLWEKGLIGSKKCLIKILGEGSLTKSLKVIAHRFSKTAMKKISLSGGQTEEIRFPGDNNKKGE